MARGGEGNVCQYSHALFRRHRHPLRRQLRRPPLQLTNSLIRASLFAAASTSRPITQTRRRPMDEATTCCSAVAPLARWPRALIRAAGTTPVYLKQNNFRQAISYLEEHKILILSGASIPGLKKHTSRKLWHAVIADACVGRGLKKRPRGFYLTAEGGGKLTTTTLLLPWPRPNEP